MKYSYLRLIGLLLLGLVENSIAQIDLSKVNATLDLTKVCKCYVSETESPTLQEIIAIDEFQNIVNPSVNTYRKAWLQCDFENNSQDTIRVLISTGEIWQSQFYKTAISLAQSNGTLTPANTRRQHPSPYTFLLEMKPLEQTRSYLMLANFSVLNTEIDIQPRLSPLETAQSDWLSTNQKNHWFGIFSGMFLAFFIYAFSLYQFNRTPFLRYWMLYIFASFWYILYEVESDPYINVLFSHYPIAFTKFKSFFNLFSVAFYVSFFRHILNLDIHLPNLNKWLKRLVWLLIITACIDLLLHFLTNHYKLIYYISLSARGVAAGFGFYSIFVTLYKKIYLANIIVLGTIAWILGSVGLILSSHGVINVEQKWLLSSPIVFLQIGTLIELFLFSLAISFKQRAIELEKIKTENQLTSLSELSVAKDQFYTEITHELRTSLTLIEGDSKQIVGNEAAKKRIVNNSQNLTYLITQILEVAKGELNLLQYQAVQMDVIPYLKHLAACFDSSAAFKNIKLYYHSKIEELVMDIDEDKLGRIIINLLSNAIKYTPENRQIEFIISHDKNHLAIIIKDSGDGIALKEQPHIFNLFYRITERSNQAMGSGIGLFIAKKYVEIMKGTIEIESNIGKGSTFKILLPIFNNAPKIESHSTYNYKYGFPKVTSVSQLPNNIKKEQNQASILVIEDKIEIFQQIHNLLAPSYHIGYAQNGKIGIEKALEQVPDLILCDVMMPGMNGFEVCEVLRKETETSHIPIIMLTAKATHADKLRGLEIGVVDYIFKPYDEKELMLTIRNQFLQMERIQSYYKTYGCLPKERINEDEFLQKVRTVIQKQYSEESFNVRQLAKHIHLSTAQLNRKMNNLTGETAQQWITTQRMQNARQLLLTTTLPIGEIAYQVGYAKPNSFSRAYKDCFQETPSETRK